MFLSLKKKILISLPGVFDILPPSSPSSSTQKLHLLHLLSTFSLPSLYLLSASSLNARSPEQLQCRRKCAHPADLGLRQTHQPRTRSASSCGHPPLPLQRRRSHQPTRPNRLRRQSSMRPEPDLWFVPPLCLLYASVRPEPHRPSTLASPTPAQPPAHPANSTPATVLYAPRTRLMVCASSLPPLCVHPPRTDLGLRQTHQPRTRLLVLGTGSCLGDTVVPNGTGCPCRFSVTCYLGGTVVPYGRARLLALCFESFNCGSLGIGELNLVSAAETVFTLVVVSLCFWIIIFT